MVAEGGVSDKPALIGELAQDAAKRLLDQCAERLRPVIEADRGMSSVMTGEAGTYDKN